jgi:hypothetical protein
MSRRRTIIVASFLVLLLTTRRGVAFSSNGCPIVSSGTLDLHWVIPDGAEHPDPGVDFGDCIVARYLLELYGEFRLRRFPRLFLFVHPLLPFGDCVPSESYDYDADLEGFRNKFGGGFVICSNLEYRITHSKWEDLGEYTGEAMPWNSSSLRLKWNHAGRLVTSGYVEGFFYPPHNEYDPNPGVPHWLRITARYGLEAYGEFRDGRLPRLYLFAWPLALFGQTHPHYDYNYDADPIVAHVRSGVGYELSKHLDVRFTYSDWVDLGQYQASDDPWNSLSVRLKW